MSLPSRTIVTASATLEERPSLKRYASRTRSSSFNHSIIRRQMSDYLLGNPSSDNNKSSKRISSFDPLSPSLRNQASHHNFLTVAHNSNGPTSSIDESGSEENDDEDDIVSAYFHSEDNKIPVVDPIQIVDVSQPLIDSPTSISHNDNNSNNKSLTTSFKQRLTISRKKGGGGGGGVGNHHQQLYDDGTNATYPPPQKQTGERDQYGFLKSSQWVTEEAYNHFQHDYAPIMKRRLLKWRQLLAENDGQWPARSSKTKRYIRKGIPPDLRGQAWLHYSGAKAKMEANKDYYFDLVKQAEEMGNENENLDIIERDLHRTFPENNRFRPEEGTSATSADKNIPIIQSLRRVLLAFSIYSPSIGYCQSLNYIAGMLLLFMDEEEEAFWAFVVLITEILPPNIYDVTMEGANIDQNVLMSLISERYPQLWNRISGGKTFWECEEEAGTGMPTCSLVTSHWFLTLFINILPIESVLRVWDCLFYDGQKVLFRVALGIFKLNENEILSVHDPLEVFQVIQNMPKRMVDCHKLIDGTYLQYASTTRVSDEEIKERRDLFKRRRDERRRNIPVQKGHKLLKRGTVRGAIIHRAKEARYYVERAKTVRK